MVYPLSTVDLSLIEQCPSERLQIDHVRRFPDLQHVQWIGGHQREPVLKRPPRGEERVDLRPSSGDEAPGFLIPRLSGVPLSHTEPLHICNGDEHVQAP